MFKSFTFVIVLLGVLIAQVTCAKPRSKPNNNVTSSQPKEENAPWLLPGFDKTQISKLGKNGRKCWANEKYHVCLTKNQDITTLFWKNLKYNSEVKIDISSDGENINQEFTYNGGYLGLTQIDDGSSKQDWIFGKDKFELNRFSDGTSKSQWVGSEHPENMEKLKKFINSWCENNDYFVGKENCVIYDKIKVNTDPAWILPGLDKNQVKQFNRNGRKCWTGTKYYACLTRNQNGTQLIWKNERKEVEVRIDVNRGGSILQDFMFQNNHIQIQRLENDSMLQDWNLGSSKFQVNKPSEEDYDSDDDSEESKWIGEENPEALKKSQEFIDAWCENNDVFVKKEDCLIYKM